MDIEIKRRYEFLSAINSKRSKNRIIFYLNQYSLETQYKQGKN